MKLPAERFYRDNADTERWHTFRVKVESTDLYVRAGRDLSAETDVLVREIRGIIREHIDLVPGFLSSLTPLTPPSGIHEVLERMYRASLAAGVGPMAAVAGAVAEYVGTELVRFSGEVIVENGGDIWMKITSAANIAVYAGNSPFSGKLQLKIHPGQCPLGICTSSGRVGPSLSFGRTHAAVVLSSDAALADAVATQAGNLVRNEGDLHRAAEYALSVAGISGACIILGEKIILQGDIELA